MPDRAAFPGVIFRAGVLPLRVVHYGWEGTNPMDRADLYRVYELGGAIHALAGISGESTLADYFHAYIGAERALDTLLGNDPQVKVELCVDAARSLKEVVSQVEKHYFRDKDGKWSYPTDDQQKLAYFAYRVTTALQNFEAVFRAEMQAASTYWVPKRGAHSTRDLVDAFDHAFLPEIRSSLGELALSEYRNAGRCFAFGLWTAAGYHSCRAVEAVLRDYYKSFTDKDVSDAKTWHHLIEELEGVETEPKPVDKTLFYLRQLKDSERNPLMHVRIVLDEQDADILLSSAKVAMVLMAREIQARSAAQNDNSLVAAIFKGAEAG